MHIHCNRCRNHWGSESYTPRHGTVDKLKFEDANMCLLYHSNSRRYLCTNTSISMRVRSLYFPPHHPPLSTPLSSASSSCPPNGPIQDMQRRRRRFTELNHAIPIDNRAMMADSPSTTMHCRSDRVFSPSIRLLISSSQHSARPPR